MNNSNTNVVPSEKRLRNISLILILSGVVTAVCLVFFFYQLFNARSNSVTPKIFHAEQIGATDTSVLLSWTSSEAAHEFVVLYRPENTGSFSELRTNQPFAAIHDLTPFTRYEVRVVPMDGDKQQEPFAMLCDTSPFCHVTDVTVSDVTEASARVTWQFDGIDRGFTVAAYAVDANGKRHMMSESISVEPGAAQECTLSHLLSEVCYTVCVMPNTQYCEVGKSTFTTLNYSREYNRFRIVRFVVCPFNSSNSLRVSVVNNLTADQPYKTSMLFNGAAEPTDTFAFRTYITDEKSRIVSESAVSRVFANPDGVSYYAYRSALTDFIAPSAPGNYHIYAVIDGVTVTKIFFRVTE